MGNFLCPPRITEADVVAVRAEAYREARQLLEADSVELEEWVMTLQEEKSRLAFGERLRTLTFELNAPFGIGLSSRNRVLEVAEGSAAEGVVAVGDCVVEVDDTSVRDAIRNVADAVDPKRALHTLVVERIAPAPRGEEAVDVVLAAVGRRWADGGDDRDDGEEFYGRLRLRCPECDATVTGELGGPQMERLRDAMDAEAAPAAPPSRRQSRRLSASPRPAPAPAPAAAPPPPPPDPAAEERRAALASAAAAASAGLHAPHTPHASRKDVAVAGAVAAAGMAVARAQYHGKGVDETVGDDGDSDGDDVQPMRASPRECLRHDALERRECA